MSEQPQEIAEDEKGQDSHNRVTNARSVEKLSAALTRMEEKLEQRLRNDEDVIRILREELSAAREENENLRAENGKLRKTRNEVRDGLDDVIGQLSIQLDVPVNDQRASEDKTQKAEE
ncbi:hypothetical protein [Kiloniella sp. b19]|uniref:hypothetical protein n=1 Tax=Kiloniella sp. GXU_MW_B19 TaxID=3141326 RepID=UPI0031DD4037